MTSSPFERQITDSETSDRMTTSSNRVSDGPQQFEASASFLDHDRPSVRLVELPAWLQSFAASVGEPDFSEPVEQPSPMSSDLDTGTLSDASLLQESRPARASEPIEPVGFATNFITEDDLPEWLRSIVPSEQDDDSADALSYGETSSAEHVAVPNVTRAWSTSKDARGIDESTSLFALVASQASQSALPASPDTHAQGARPQMGERSAANAQAEATGMVASYGSEMPPDMRSSDMHMSATLGSERGGDQVAQPKLPMLPIAVAAILLIVLVVVAMALFVL